MQPHPSGPRKPQGVVPGKLNLPSRWPGEGLGGVVALDGLDDAGKGAGEEGVEDVVEDGLLLESRWFMAGGCSCRTRDTGSGRSRIAGKPGLCHLFLTSLFHRLMMDLSNNSPDLPI